MSSDEELSNHVARLRVGKTQRGADAEKEEWTVPKKQKYLTTIPSYPSVKRYRALSEEDLSPPVLYKKQSMDPRQDPKPTPDNKKPPPVKKHHITSIKDDKEGIDILLENLHHLYPTIAFQRNDVIGFLIQCNQGKMKVELPLESPSYYD